MQYLLTNLWYSLSCYAPWEMPFTLVFLTPTLRNSASKFVINNQYFFSRTDGWQTRLIWRCLLWHRGNGYRRGLHHISFEIYGWSYARKKQWRNVFQIRGTICDRNSDSCLKELDDNCCKPGTLPKTNYLAKTVFSSCIANFLLITHYIN